LQATSSTRKPGLKSWVLSFKTFLIAIASVFPACWETKADTPADYETRRLSMARQDIKERGISDPAVLKAMETVPRHLFIEPSDLPHAYSDTALSIKENQTISQPFVVALMTEAAQLAPNYKVLEVGTGSGYQAAVLSEIVAEVYTIEIIKSLAENATKRFEELGYNNIHSKWGDGYASWPEKSPFDAIIITAAAPKIPRPLIRQLKNRGRIVLPLGASPRSQKLIVLTKNDDALERTDIGSVVFVPMTGEVRK
jgi:protein-L-isoaspartate(D-aspartate) O-methyltransferase